MEQPKRVEVTVEGREQQEGKVHPWVRFFARIFDYNLFGAFVLFFLIFFDFRFVFKNSLFIGIIFFWIFVESLLLSTWGTTPGKWLLKVHVRDKKGRKPPFKTALSRSLTVWWLGMGAGLPIINLITMIVACVKLSNTGITTWDKWNDTVITHEKIGFLRVFVMILCFVFIGLFTLSVLKTQPLVQN